MIEKKSLVDILKRVAYLPERTPEMAFNGRADLAFSEVAPYRNGAISVGYYSGNTEWERHPGGGEIVMPIEGSTTLVLLVKQQTAPDQPRLWRARCGAAELLASLRRFLAPQGDGRHARIY